MGRGSDGIGIDGIIRRCSPSSGCGRRRRGHIFNNYIMSSRSCQLFLHPTRLRAAVYERGCGAIIDIGIHSLGDVLKKGQSKSNLSVRDVDSVV